MMSHLTNPFATRFIRPGALDFILPENTSVNRLLVQFHDHQCLGQIMGDHGTGKSTLLAKLVERLIDRGSTVCRIHDPERARMHLLKQLVLYRGRRGVVVIDGFERLSRLARFFFVRLARGMRTGLLVTCHRDCGLPTIWRTQMDLSLAEQIVARLIRDGSERRCLARYDLAARLAAHQGNLREVLFDLYDFERGVQSAQTNSSVLASE